MTRPPTAPLLALPLALLLAQVSSSSPLPRAAGEPRPDAATLAPEGAAAPLLPPDADIVLLAIPEAEALLLEMGRDVGGGPARAMRGAWLPRPAEFVTIAPHAAGEVGLVTARSPGAVDDAATAALRAAARRVEACWRGGRLAEAQAIVARTPGMFAWDAAGEGVHIAAFFRQSASGGRLGVTVSHARGGAPVAVAFPPGTYGRSAPEAQDLAFLRAAIVVLGPDETDARLEVPVACADFHGRGPRTGERFELARFEAGSAVDDLLARLCAGDPAPEVGAQLALWLEANGIPFGEAARSRYITFDSYLPIGRAGASEARDVLSRGR